MNMIRATDLILSNREAPRWLLHSGGIRWPHVRMKSTSVSRARLHRQCPEAYARRYHYRYIPRCAEEGCGEPVYTSSAFGTMCHGGHADPSTLPLDRPRQDQPLTAWREESEEPATVGTLVHEIVDETISRAVEAGDKRLDGDWAEKRFDELFEKYGLRGQEPYQDGLDMLRSFFLRHADMDLSKVVASELDFVFAYGDYTVQGYMDLVEHVEGTRYRLTDYKSNWMLFSEDELRVDLQLGVYGYVLRRFFGATEVDLQFEMLRHGVTQSTMRSAEQCEDAVRYLCMLSKQAEDRKDFPAVLNKNCPWCDVNADCETYQRAMREEPDDVVGALAKGDFDTLAKQREQLRGIEKIASRRIGQIDKIFQKKIEEDGGPFEAGGSVYALQSPGWKEYPIERMLKVMARFKIEPDLSQFAVVFKKKLDTYVNALDMMPSLKNAMRHQIEGASIPSQKEPEVKGSPLRK